MKITVAISFVITAFLCCTAVFAEPPILNRFAPTADYHAGLHSGAWTLRREALLEDEKKDPYRSCDDPYCNRCAKHLADYGHEYQYIGGPNQRQPWYRGTAGNIAATTRRGYDQHGIPYARRGQPAAVISWEYTQTLNHAIWEQVNARNAVAAEEAAYYRLKMLESLLSDSQEQFRLTKEAWDAFVAQGGTCAGKVPDAKVAPCSKTYKQFSEEVKSGQQKAACNGLCPYCLAKARYCFDQEYVKLVNDELCIAKNDWLCKRAGADEAVRVALLSKDDADKATRFVRIQNKPPKVKEAEATRAYLAMLAAEQGKTSSKPAQKSVEDDDAAASNAKETESENSRSGTLKEREKPKAAELIDEP